MVELIEESLQNPLLGDPHLYKNSLEAACLSVELLVSVDKLPLC